MGPIIEQKIELRNRLKLLRSVQNKAQRQCYDQSIYIKTLSLSEIISAQTIFCFLSYGTEVDTHSLINTLQTQGKTVVVPKIINSQQMIAILFNSWEQLEPGHLGILTPTTSEPYHENIDVCITPGLGFSLCGHRLGFGRGYYDKWFFKNTVKHKIALAYECQIVADIPSDQHDINMGMIMCGIFNSCQSR